jgi:hypothetical protein
MIVVDQGPSDIIASTDAINWKADWASIHRQAYVFEDGCWTTCNGGFCCSNNHPDFDFRFVPMHGTTIIYMKDEYDYLSRHGRVPPRSEMKEFVFDIGDKISVSCLYTTCSLLGKCNGVIDKPLLCRLYPFLPVFDGNGKVQDLLPASIFDLTFEVFGMQTPCTVSAKRRAYKTIWSNENFARDILMSPYILFHLELCRHFIDVYRETAPKSLSLQGASGKRFWSLWEMEYLFGHLIDADELRQRASRTYAAYCEKHGQFL